MTDFIKRSQCRVFPGRWIGGCSAALCLTACVVLIALRALHPVWMKVASRVCRQRSALCGVSGVELQRFSLFGTVENSAKYSIRVSNL